ncbi:DUF3368 domain-containing protein [Halobacteriales archaeon QS_1_68_20]|nr:MAG: DUF3368 domain-containing protein [Halobacteriales archaeon QS_1_68_20]
MFVFDATPLIYLSKAEQLTVLEELDRERIVPEAVYEEVVVNGIRGGYPDARRVERAIEDGVFGVRAAPDNATAERLRGNPNIGPADVAVLALADHLDGTAVMDEDYGRAVADSEGIETRGTAFVLLTLLKRGLLDTRETRETIDAMVEAGWYCSPDLYAKILGKIESLS